MGYRSDVGWACDPAVAEVIDAVLELYFESVKWYEGYHEVDMFNRLMEMLDANGLDDFYGFIRIGEETDDIEQRGVPYEYDMYINRSIEI